MERIRRRSASVLLLAALMLAGAGVYVARFAIFGETWASSPINRAVHRDGLLAAGTVTDRNGVELASLSAGTPPIFAEDEKLRRASLHIVGDIQGNIGTGALSAFKARLIGYDVINGVYSRDGRGGDVTLAVDSRLQLAAYDALAGRRGCVIVSNYKTGEILCAASSPSYDPENPPGRDVIEGNALYEGVYINRAISAAYTPGSVFKLVTAAAAIENIDGIYDRVFECGGALSARGGDVTCSRAHGTLTFEDALAVSCNVAFGELALELGAGTLALYAERLGVTGRGEIEGVTTAAGRFDAAAEGTADLAWSGVGQYNDMVCPVSMLRFVAAVANGGFAADMRLTARDGIGALLPAGGRRVLDGETARLLALMMNYNVGRTYGADNFPDLDLYAKSGTAEAGAGELPHSWFVGYITNEGAPLAFVVVIENGGAGVSAAAPAANAVLSAALNAR